MFIIKIMHALLALCLGFFLFTGLAAALMAWVQLIIR